jgi:hypothetical protein
MPQPAQNVPNMKLGEMNERLSKHGLPIIAQNQVLALQQVASRSDIINAVLDLDFTPEAKTYLQDCFNKARIFPSRPASNTVSGAQRPMGGTGGPRRPDMQHQPSARNAPAQNNNQHNSGQRPQRAAPQQEAVRSAPPPAQSTNPSGRQDNNGQGYSQSGTEDTSQGHVLPVEERMSTHVYARNNAALCFQADVSKNGFKTIAVDGAKAAGSNFDWQNKIRIQLTKAEIPAVLAVLAGYSQYCEFKNHGQASNKGFSMERQGEKVYMKIFEKSKPMIGVPIHPQDLFYVYSLVLKRMIDESPWLDGQTALQLVRDTQPNKSVPAQNPNPQQHGQQGYQGGQGYQRGPSYNQRRA